MILFSKPNETGQGLLEYALIVMLIALVVIVSLGLIPPPIGEVFTHIGETLSSF